MSLFHYRRFPRPASWVFAAGLILTGCESVRPSSPLEPVERPFAEVFAPQSRVRLQASPGDPIAGPMALLRWGDHVVVLDGMQSNLKLFDASGALVRTIGRAGDGPGEFRHPSAATVMPDGSLAVLDGAGRHVSRFSKAGAYLSRWRVEGISPTGISSLGDGRLLVGARSPGADRGADARLRVYSADGRLEQSFASIIADGRAEAGIQKLLPARVGHTALAAADSRLTVRFRDLASGKDWTADFGLGLIPRPNWEQLADDGKPSTLLAWSNRQHWTGQVFALDSTRFLLMVRGPMENGEPRVRYVAGDLDGNTLAVTPPVPTVLMHASGGTVYGLEMTDDGEFDLLTFRLRLQDQRHERQAAR